LAVQLAKHHYGAEVTGVCGTLRLDYVKALGADQVIDYKKQDFTQNGETYDVIFDVLGRVLFTVPKVRLYRRASCSMPASKAAIQEQVPVEITKGFEYRARYGRR